MATRGRCHKCGNEVRMVLDGEEWCSHCQAYQRPRAHGWQGKDATPCPISGTPTHMHSCLRCNRTLVKHPDGKTESCPNCASRIGRW